MEAIQFLCYFYNSINQKSFFNIWFKVFDVRKYIQISVLFFYNQKNKVISIIKIIALDFQWWKRLIFWSFLYLVHSDSFYFFYLVLMGMNFLYFSFFFILFLKWTKKKIVKIMVSLEKKIQKRWDNQTTNLFPTIFKLKKKNLFLFKFDLQFKGKQKNFHQNRIKYLVKSMSEKVTESSRINKISIVQI